MKRVNNLIHINSTLLINIFLGLSVGIMCVVLWGNFWWIGFGLGAGLATGSYTMILRIKDIKLTERK